VEQARGLRPQAFVAPESVPIVLQQMASWATEPYEGIGRKSDGSEFPMLVRGQSAIVDGEPTRITSAIDLTAAATSMRP
jgi:hypothetical protein